MTVRRWSSDTWSVGLMVTALVLTTAACVGTPQQRAQQAAGAPSVTAVAGADAQTVPAGQLCPTSPQVSVLECTIFSLFPPTAMLCVGTQTPKQGEPACLLPKPGSELNMAWILADSPGASPRRTLTLFRGTNTLTPVVRAADNDGSHWATATVCPRDIDGDGLLDAVLTFRTVGDPDHLWIATVRLNDTVPQLMSLPRQRALLSDGQGCQAKILNRLAYDQRSKQLRLNPGT